MQKTISFNLKLSITADQPSSREVIFRSLPIYPKFFGDARVRSGAGASACESRSWIAGRDV